MKKVIAVFIVATLLLSITVFAQSDDSDKELDNVKQKAEKKLGKGKVTNVSKLDQSKWRDRVNIMGIGNKKLGIYEITTSDNPNKPVFAITASGSSNFVQQQKSYSISFLNFGLSQAQNSGFMKTSTGTMSGLNKGYVMTRSGSITGVSTSLEVNENSNEYIEIVILKNGEEVGFGNRVSSSVGTEKDFDSLSRGTIEFSAGDVISAYVKTSSGISDVNTLIEISTE